MGFAKTEKAKTTPRVRFEAISIGVTLALRETPNLIPQNIRNWLETDAFEKETTTHGEQLPSKIEETDRICP